MPITPVPFGPIRPRPVIGGSFGARSFMQVWNGRGSRVAAPRRG